MYKLTINGTTKLIFYVYVAFLSFVLLGINRAYSTFFFHQLDLPNSIVKLERSQQSWIASCITLLSPVGSLIIGPCLDYFGRRLTLKLLYLPYIISWIMLAFSVNATMFYVSFLIRGIGAGMSSCVCVYISEITIPRYRAALYAIMGISYNIGILLSHGIMYYVLWHTAAMIFFGLSIVALILNSFLPESPFWLYSKGHVEKSINTLCLIRCTTRDQLGKEIQDMEKFCTLQEKLGFKETFQNCCRAWKPLLILCLLFVLSFNTGYMLVILFLIKILDDLNTPYDSGQLSVAYSIVGVLTSFVMPYFLYKVNRKTALALSSSGMAVAMVAVALYKEFCRSSTFSWVVPTAFCFYSFSSNMGTIPLGPLMIGELLPNESRGVISSLFGVAGFVYMSFVQKMFPGYMATFGTKTCLWSFAFFSFTITIFAIYVLPETKGKTLNEIQEKYFRIKSPDLNQS